VTTLRDWAVASDMGLVAAFILVGVIAIACAVLLARWLFP